jgi:hypothetical protein
MYILTTIYAGAIQARRLLEAIPMAKDLDSEFQILNTAVKARDKVTYAKWDAEFTAWMSGDRSGPCPFETEDSLQRMCLFICRMLHV